MYVGRRTAHHRDLLPSRASTSGVRVSTGSGKMVEANSASIAGWVARASIKWAGRAMAGVALAKVAGLCGWRKIPACANISV